MKNLTKTLLLGAIFLMATGRSEASSSLRVSPDGGTTWVVIDDNGPLDTDPTVGVVEYDGPIGNWSVSISSGQSEPFIGSPATPNMDLNTINSSTQPASLIVQYCDSGLTTFASETYIDTLSYNTGGTVIQNAYRDSGNVIFGTSQTYSGGAAGTSPSPTALLLSSTGPVSGANSFSNGMVVSASGNFPNSLTIETVIIHNGTGRTSTDAHLRALPQPTCGGQIGDFIWNDVNGNGCQDANEPGIAGVKVDLYSGCSPKGALVQTTTTDANGKYLFTGLCAGNYTVSITTPNGFVHTIAHQGCGGIPGDAHNPTDSNCECTGADNCDVCVNLPTDNSIDLTIDCGYVGSQPCLTFLKTPDTNSAPAGSIVGYTYAITNCGGTTFTNLAIIDDAGTPGFTADDFSITNGLNLAPGEGASFHVLVNLPVVTCVSNSNPSVNAGLLIATVLPSGDVKVTYRQSRNLNDNVYGTSANNLDGWTKHNFSDLTGSDKCEFRFTDSTGKVVLDFFSDYITQAASSLTPTGTVVYPSGYGSLGPNGGDGSMVTGAKSNVLFWTSTLADNLNSGLNGGFPSPYLLNSPAPESSFPNWDYVDGYTVIVSKYAFGAAGFGGVTVPQQHNSPAKTGSNAVYPVLCGGCITNIATVVTVDANNNILATVASDDAVVCTGTPTPPPPTCIITEGAFKIDKNTIQIPLKDGGTANIVLSEVDLTWNQGVNGKITKMSLNGDFYTPAPGAGAGSPATLSSGFVSDANKRTIGKGLTKTLVITFEHPASKTLGDYTGVLKFGTCTVNFP
jgi:hypothetical protein